MDYLISQFYLVSKLLNLNLFIAYLKLFQKLLHWLQNQEFNQKFDLFILV